MDFLSDQLFNGQKFQALTTVDIFSRKCLAILAWLSIKGTDEVEIPKGLKYIENEKPTRIQVENGSEFIS